MMNNVGRRAERGSALVYILIAIALLAALTVAFMGSSSQQTQSQSTFKLVSELNTQIDFIRSSVQECVLTYPGGDNTATAEIAAGADHRYPLRPTSAHLTAPGPEDEVRYLKCPGNPGDAPNHTPLYSGASGKFMPPKPDLFGEWKWYNGKDGVFFWIESTKSDSYIRTALEKLGENYGTCESDMVDNSEGNAAIDMDSDATSFATCPPKSYCFRVWMKPSRTTPSPAVYPGKAADCPE